LQIGAPTIAFRRLPVSSAATTTRWSASFARLDLCISAVRRGDVQPKMMPALRLAHGLVAHLSD
jgi:hypothetical protein